MKETMKKIAKSNITFGIVMGTMFWGMGKLVDKSINNAYSTGFSDGVDAHKTTSEFVDKLNEAMNK